jgi:hypothetical protein
MVTRREPTAAPPLTTRSIPRRSQRNRARTPMLHFLLSHQNCSSARSRWCNRVSAHLTSLDLGLQTSTPTCPVIPLATSTCTIITLATPTCPALLTSMSTHPGISMSTHPGISMSTHSAMQTSMTRHLHRLLDTEPLHHLSDTESLHPQIRSQLELLPHPARTSPSPMDHDSCDPQRATSSVETRSRALSVLCRDVHRSYPRRPHSLSCGHIAPTHNTVGGCSTKAIFLVRSVATKDSLIRPTVYITTQSLDALTKTCLPINVRSLAVSGFQQTRGRVSSGRQQSFYYTTPTPMPRALPTRWQTATSKTPLAT